MSTRAPNWNEFRSDTFTTPTAEMLNSVASATVGDSVYLEDEDTLALEKQVRELTGHEAGLYCVSGTLSNQIALRSHLNKPPHSVLCDYRSHVYRYEAAGLATLSQALVTPVIPKNGVHLTLDDIQRNLIPDEGNIHYAPTRVVSLENTLNGILFPIEELRKISQWCRSKGIALHCDGARIWNASIATGISLKEYGSLFDSISLCLSKGLGAPIGSVLVGSKDLIRVANHFKKQNGGGIRQAGIIARMGSLAITQNWPKLEQSHKFAKEVAEHAQSLGLELESPCDTSFVFLHPETNHIDPKIIGPICKKHNVKAGSFRFAFSFQNTQEAIDSLKAAITEIKQYADSNPFDNAGGASIY
ncbi:hypothetical protein OGAPHI_006363 [Ogataea philodendri]|uniref:low-specificity L-threonine aldolase n=1 Tax=Ogataea philodendri TaxID=1378263 RepID=A0A9P8T0J7_9ASCO|nr:uncharacterized protein OGAPHI_006363 [Ogataea philodendri]KAH3661516.1 hypothetical protein OGAPHI_006363 [Ogataea philodendri]